MGWKLRRHRGRTVLRDGAHLGPNRNAGKRRALDMAGGALKVKGGELNLGDSGSKIDVANSAGPA